MWQAELREQVLVANLAIVDAGLVVLQFGNVSGLDRARGVLAIKPSGVPYPALRPDDLPLVDVETGTVVEGRLRPSSDTPTHVVLYRAFPSVGGVVHTHSRHAVAWAQAKRPIPSFGTTHADHYRGEVPVTRTLDPEEIAGEYEARTGAAIVEAIAAAGGDALETPGVLVACHGPFAWGSDAAEAVDHAIALEAVAGMALQTLALQPSAVPIDAALHARHYTRKHGAGAYYGQPR
jgi:L-ribulose-5-phosphate 4-epimerase